MTERESLTGRERNKEREGVCNEARSGINVNQSVLGFNLLRDQRGWDQSVVWTVAVLARALICRSRRHRRRRHPNEPKSLTIRHVDTGGARQ